MIELLAGLSAILAVLLIVAIVYAVTYRQERDDFRDLHEANAKSHAGIIEILDNRVTTLRGDNEALTKELEELKRKIGRMEAEARAAKPKRGPGGKFVSKPKAPKSLKASKSTPKPVACG